MQRTADTPQGCQRALASCQESADVRYGERCECVGPFLRPLFAPRGGGERSEEGVGEHDGCDVPEPTDVAANFVLVQAALVLRAPTGRNAALVRQAPSEPCGPVVRARFRQALMARGRQAGTDWCVRRRSAQWSARAGISTDRGHLHPGRDLSRPRRARLRRRPPTVVANIASPARIRPVAAEQSPHRPAYAPGCVSGVSGACRYWLPPLAGREIQECNSAECAQLQSCCPFAMCVS